MNTYSNLAGAILIIRFVWSIVTGLEDRNLTDIGFDIFGITFIVVIITLDYMRKRKGS